MTNWLVGIALVCGLSSFARAEDAGAEETAIPVLQPVVGMKSITASSTFADKKKPDRHAAWRVLTFPVDEKGNPQTAWCEGKADEGIGEAVTIDLGGPTKLDSIQIAAGFWKTDKLYKANNVITGIDVTIDGTTTSLKPTKRGAWLKVATKKPVSTISIKVTAATKGKMNDSCISGVKLMRGKTALVPLQGVDPAGAALLTKSIEKIQAVLASGDYSLFDKIIWFPFEYDDAANFSMGGEAVRYKSSKELVAACKKRDADVAADKTDDMSFVCPGPEYMRDAGDEGELSVVTGNVVQLAWPGTGREVRVIWVVEWKNNAWKLTQIGYTGFGDPDMDMPEE